MGVSPSGAADAIALRVVNRLVGNAEGAAGLEMTLLGGTFVFPEGGVLALTGSDFGATLDDAPAPLWASREVKPGQTLRLRSTRSSLMGDPDRALQRPDASHERDSRTLDRGMPARAS